MKLKELLKGRKKLQEYDSLEYAVKELRRVQSDNGEPYECESHPYQLSVQARNGNRSWTTFTITPNAMQAIITALEAEIVKLDEE